MFRTNKPVTGGAFVDRKDPLDKLRAVVHRLYQGEPEWLVVIGPRKVGKTSLLDDRPILREFAERAVDVIGIHPFYVQLLGEEIVSRTPPYDDRTLKEALQSLLFSRTGRLALFFRHRFDAGLVAR